MQKWVKARALFSRSFSGSRGRFYKKAPWPPEALKRKCFKEKQACKKKKKCSNQKKSCWLFYLTGLLSCRRWDLTPTSFFPQSTADYRRQAEDFLQADKIETPPEFKHQARRFLYYQNFATPLSFGGILLFSPVRTLPGPTSTSASTPCSTRYSTDCL